MNLRILKLAKFEMEKRWKGLKGYLGARNSGGFEEM